ncbi:DUF2500 domain-containing protein [Photobacterium sp. OFAV2-7]|uniref:DUF2500 domain-containing protein n=1 Tax=Photobacterium sp. OFAV2-7 TaxID=2917748 RepID=UPI001EF3DC6F|nr:DUF2500 domain-containing protein [Photobacterium sp. OFAV2-7]MCG7584170.1 DUF2500 domain-containing protein [Photobacterium sp. OFAV2-7]
MPIGIVLAVAILFVISLVYFIRFYRRHVQGENAPEKKVEVEILAKQSVPVIGAQPGDDNEEYWIYVQPTKGGPKREFLVGIHYYHALNPGDRGIMTYKGLSFIHFALTRD